VIKEDGTIYEYLAHATDDNWGTPLTHRWEIQTHKYTDTGERYYAFHGKGDTNLQAHAEFTPADFFHEQGCLYNIDRVAIICDGPSVQYHVTKGPVIIMERGDKFPFSK
jgi:hypothetical protein